MMSTVDSFLLSHLIWSYFSWFFFLKNDDVLVMARFQTTKENMQIKNTLESWLRQYIDLSCTKTRIFWDNYVNTMAAEALSPCFTKSSATVVLAMHNKLILSSRRQISITSTFSMLRNKGNAIYFIINYVSLNKFSMATLNPHKISYVVYFDVS